MQLRHLHLRQQSNLKMSTRKVALSLAVLTIFFVIQESAMSQFRLPGGGFSIFLILVFVWSAISASEIALVIGFAAGFMLDLVQASDSPFGQWTLILILVCYLVSYVGFGDTNPLGVVFIVIAANFAAQVLFLASGALLGVQIGALGQILITLVGTSIWTLVFTPMVLPLFSKLHEFIFDTRASL